MYLTSNVHICLFPRLQLTLREQCRSWTSCRSIVRSSLKEGEACLQKCINSKNLSSWGWAYCHNTCNIKVSPSWGHVRGQVSGIMEQLIVLEQLLCWVVRLHALRTDEALKSRNTTSDSTMWQWLLQVFRSASKKVIERPALPQTSDRGSGLCWAAPTLRSGSLPSQESGEESIHYISLNVLKHTLYIF